MTAVLPLGLTTRMLFCLLFWCSSTRGSGSNIAVVVRSPVATLREPTTITVYRDDAGRSVTFDKAVLQRGASISLDSLQYRNNDPRIPENATLDTTSEPATLTLPVTMTTSERHGIYSITVTENNGKETILRALITNENATITAAEYSTIVSKGETVTMRVEIPEASSVTESSLRWRVNGSFSASFNGRTGYVLEKAETSSVFECFPGGRYLNNSHGIMNLITRGCPKNKTGPNCADDCQRCFNGGVCSDKTVSCLCPPGFSGDHCENVHGRNVFGQNAEYTCTDTTDDHDDGCRGAIICYPEPFGCICPAGYMGIDCMTECPDGKFGANCKQDCHCRDGVNCTKDSGVCEDNMCADRWKGINCQVEDPCEVGVYGDMCTLPCSCESKDCTNVESNCTRGCAVPWTGTACKENSGLGVITSLNYEKVNPGDVTSVACISIRNPGLEAEELELVGVPANFSSSTLVSFDGKIYGRVSTWMVILQSNPALVASCSITGTNISQSLVLTPYRLPQYTSTRSPLLSFPSITSSSIFLSWPQWTHRVDEGDGPIKEYFIEYREEGGIFTEGARTTTETFSNITGLKADTLYDFRIVLSRDGPNGDGPPSEIHSQRTLCGVFTMSPALMLDSITSRNATFIIGIPPEDHWNCRDITVSLQRQQSNGDWNVVQELSSSAQATDIIDLIPCTSYAFRVQLNNSESLEMSVPVLVSTPPEGLIVRNLTVFASTFGQLNVSWLPFDMNQTKCVISTYNVTYRLIRHIPCAQDATGAVSITQTTASTSVALSDLSDYAEYEVVVRADGEGEGLEIIAIGTTSPGAPSAAPTDIILAGTTSTCLQFGWKPPPCNSRNGLIVAYQYSMSLTNGTANETVVSNSSTEKTGVELCDLIPYFEYHFIVRASTYVGQGPESEMITARTDEDVPPQIDPPRFSFANASSLHLQWQAPYPPHGIITGYNISVQLIGNSQSNASFIVSVDAENAVGPPSFILSDLEPFRNYTVMVRANTRIGPGKWSLGATSETKDGLSSPPQNLKVSNRSKFSLTVEWDVPHMPRGDIIRYEICPQALEKPYNTDFKVMSCGPLSTISSPHAHIIHHITSLEPSTVYHIQVSAYTLAGQGSLSSITARTELADEFATVQRGDISQIEREGAVANIRLPPLTEIYATHYFIRVKDPKELRRSVGGIGSFEDNQNDYITAEIEKGDEGDTFTIGDGKNYEMYRNVPLDESREYEIYIGTGSRVGEETKVVWSEPFPLSTTDKPAPVYLISLIVIPALLIVLIIVYIKVGKNSSNDKQATDGDEDNDYLSPAMAKSDDPQNYIPLEEQLRNASSCKYEDISHKPQDGGAISEQYDDTIVSDSQKPEASPRYQTRNMKGVNSVAYESVDDCSEYRQLPEVPQSHLSDDKDEENSYEVPNTFKEHTGVYINVKAKPVQPRQLKVAEFQNFMSRSKEDVVNDIVQQFMALPSGEQHPCSVASKFQNKPKNFFKAILAYDHSRIKLDVTESDARSDYINASYIKNQQGETYFIAAQGPQEGTADDFWKMVWQENVETIVMATDNIEGNKNLCYPYWPNKVHTSEVFDDVTVLLMESTTYTTHTIRKLNVLKGYHKPEVHSVTQVQIHSWPYGSVPKKPASLVSIMRMVKSLHTDATSSPMLVHCSNGVGATGTFIAVFVLMDTIKKDRNINIYEFVKRMRDERLDMVQTRVQYFFIFECLLAVLQSTDSQVSCDQLKKLNDAEIKLKAGEEFKLLQESVKGENVEDYVGNLSENQHKNRFKNLIPADKFRPMLKSEGSTFGSNGYINAVQLKNFSGREFIMTQTPLSSTVEDFWRLVYDYGCRAIVMLNTVGGSDETVIEYWPCGGGVQYGFMRVECKSTTKMDSCIHSQFEVSHKKGGQLLSVDHFVLSEWSGNQPDVPNLRQFIKCAGHKNKGPVLVHCINGIGLSAVYVIVKTEIEKLEQEGLADVFQSLTNLRKISPLAVQTQEEYTLCYQLIKDYLDSNEQYAVVY